MLLQSEEGRVPHCGLGAGLGHLQDALGSAGLADNTGAIYALLNALLVVGLVVHAVARAAGIVREHGGGVGLVPNHGIGTQSPQYDGNAAAVVPRLLRVRQCIDAVLPLDVHVPAEAEHHSVGLREVKPGAIRRVQEGQLPGCAERHAHRDVLVLCSASVEGGGVVVERLPVRSVSVPVESSTHLAIIDIEVATNAPLNHCKCFRSARVLRNQMSPFMPTYPIRFLHSVRLSSTDLLH
mmetsp:Transcript_16744/g.23035  ORF Transcript_16744/g.23035 Transcript_16744/m.23035 type:complete len:238 (-) Transcript_16744:343-1056(-)